jgi:hypothetical protein
VVRLLVLLLSAGFVTGPPPLVTPSVSITSPADGAVVTSKKIRIAGTAITNGSGFDHLTLNGETVFPAPLPKPDNTVDFSIPVTLKLGRNTFTVALVDKDQTSAEAEVTVTYRLGSCRASAHDVGTRSEFDLKCTKAIKDGSFSFLVNRSGCERGCNPTVKVTGTGDLFCGGQSLFHGRQPYENLTCEGSLAAGSTAKVFQRFETHTIPCDAPAFKGTFSVNFGDGSKQKSRKLPAYRCPARVHKRFFGLFHAGLSAVGGAGFVAELRIADGFETCIKRVPFLLQVRSGGGWRTVFRTRTHGPYSPLRHGVWSVAVFGVVSAGGPYRAVAPKVRFRNQTCAAATRTN